jgi:hypothetical protein
LKLENYGRIYLNEWNMTRPPAIAPSLGIDRSGRASRMSGQPSRCAKYCALGRPAKALQFYEVPVASQSVIATPFLLHILVAVLPGLPSNERRHSAVRAGWRRDLVVLT